MFGQNPNQQREANYAKNRGQPGLWFAHTADYTSPRPQPRVQARAQATADKYKGCESNELLHNDKLTPETDAPPHRLRDEDAERNAEKFNHQEERWFDFEGNQTYYPDKPPTRLGGPRAQNIKETRNLQRHGEWYEHRHNPEDADPPPKGRLPGGRGAEHKERMHHNEVGWDKHKSSWTPREPVSPTPPRTRAEGLEFALRSRGTASEWMSHHTVQDDAPSGQGGPLRCGSRQAAENWEKSRGRAMRDCFDYTAKHEEPAPVPKARGANAQEIREKNSQTTSGLLQEPRPQDHSEEDGSHGQGFTRTRPEARAFAERNTGSLGQYFDQQNNRDYNSPRPQPRLPTGAAQAVAERNKGVMDGVLAKPEYQNPVYKKPLQPRGAGTSAAKDIAKKNTGSSAAFVMGTSNLPPEDPPAARVTRGGEEFAQRNKGSVGSLFTQYGRLGPEDQPAPRMRPGAAQENAERYRGSEMFNVIQQARG